MQSRYLCSLLTATTLLGGLFAQHAGKLAADRQIGAAAVTVDECKAWLGKLASPEFGGRGTGQDGFRIAAEYVRDHFKALGLEPLGDDGTFFQKVPWSAAKVDTAASSLTFAKDKQQVVVPAARMAGSAGASMALNGPVVLLRSTTPEALANLDLTGKIVLLQVEDTSDARAVFTALRPLQGLGAAAILTVQRQWVSGGIQGRGGASRGAGNRAAQGTRGRPASLSFGGDDLTAVLGLAGVDPAGTEALTDLGLTADLKLVIADGDAPAWNVVGRLPGSDPARKDECVVIGSHLDHLGRRGSTIYPGADDDGSGTTGVLAVAQMFARNKVRPARSIVFVCFCGEENGLVGSRYFVQNCPIPLASIVSELQMDMIGRDEEANSESRTEAERSEQAEQNLNTVHLIGTQKLAPALHELCMAKNGTAGFELEWDQEGMFGRSDHANFARMGVPIAFFFTGLHADYHQPSDTPDKIHYEKLLRIATWVYDIGFELATQAARPEIDPQLWAAYRSRGSEQPAAPMAGGNGGGR